MADVLTKMEFAVQMSCQACGEAVKRALDGVRGVEKIFIDVDNELVLVESSLLSSQVQERLEATGKLVVFRGYGGASAEPQASPGHHGAAVAIMKGPTGGRGLARLVQTSPERCVIEGTADSLAPGEEYCVRIHQYGDLSSGFESCGDVFRAPGDTIATGNLGNTLADDTGRATFQVASETIKVWDVIGRSMIIHHREQRVLGGIVARSAGLFQNTKKICTCDGVTLWDEAKRSKVKSISAVL